MITCALVIVKYRKDVFISMVKKRIRVASIAAAAVFALGALPLSASADENDTVYLKMNIPYADFYSSDVTNNSQGVDAVSSATDAKWKKFSVTYFKDNSDGVGGTIYGVSFPVAVSAADAKKLKSVSDETSDYYYAEFSETPSVYKELSLKDDGSYSFSAVQGNKETVAVDDCSLTSETPWGDYLFEFADQNIINGDVYGIVVTTSDGSDYGMRHLENIWLKNYEFSWSSGFKTTEPHGNTLNPNHYRSIMGKTITNIEYITTTGIYDYTVEKYVPVVTGSKVTAADASVDAGKTAVEVSPQLPDDYDAAYSVKDLNTEYADGTLSFSNAAAGTYTLSVEDKSGKYAPMSASYVLSTDKAAAKYDASSKKLVSAGDYAAFASFLKNISTVSVDGKSYSASGKKGTKIVNTDDGTIDLAVESRDGKVFDTDNKDSFEMTVSAAGYPDVTFTLSAKEKAADNTSSVVTSSNTSNITSDVSSTSSVTTTSQTSSTNSSVFSETSSQTSSTNSSASSETASQTSSTNSSASSGTSSVTSPKTSGRTNAFALTMTAVLSLAAIAFSVKKSSIEQ